MFDLFASKGSRFTGWRRAIRIAAKDRAKPNRFVLPRAQEALAPTGERFQFPSATTNDISRSRMKVGGARILHASVAVLEPLASNAK